ncbi:MAG TPA: DUF1549 domain-containing protein [Bryobacteraceae bacterium]|nr:DUF1549 domain-containing protein [Bryobacteraceae bacterium]
MKRNVGGFLALAGIALSGVAGWAQTAEPEEPANADHAECTFFGPKRAQFLEAALGAARRPRRSFSQETEEIVGRLGGNRGNDTRQFVPGGSRTYINQQSAGTANVVDRHIFGVLQSRGIEPAPRSTDYEFMRRVSLDLTGRVPRPERVTAFVSDSDADKRSKYVDELLQSPEWVDKWTMFFGDLFRNTDQIRATNTVRRAEGREAFSAWIRQSLLTGKPYNKMAYELIAAEGTNSWTQGELNWQIGNRTTGGPAQDNFDQMAASTMETFLGVSHFNCVMCHNGRGHVDSLSLWGKNTSRLQAYGFAAFFAQTTMTQQPRDQRPDPNIYYWSLANVRTGGYSLNTTTGNRPPRTPIGSTRTVAPDYPFGDGATANAGETPRAAAARLVTSDFQFARAAVNYLWRELMVRGLVEPVNQMDPERLDPDNPPPSPWTLQPSNAALLRDLAQEFIDGGYNIRALMRRIVTSDAYQLSARYPGQWNPDWEGLHARRLVKRLWAEEVYDAIVQTSNLPAPITMTVTTRIANGAAAETRVVPWAMQTTSPSSRGGATAFLNAFYPGDREDTDRRRDGSDQQALTLMNNALVMNRTRSSTSAGQDSLLKKNINKTDRELIETLYLTVLSRLPDESERAAAGKALTAGNRQQAAENLLWALFNKVDFFFNY